MENTNIKNEKMMDNVCDFGKGKERENECGDNVASTLPEKFKDVNALYKAYLALQAEFTRRCQRLKELETKADNLPPLPPDSPTQSPPDLMRKQGGDGEAGEQKKGDNPAFESNNTQEINKNKEVKMEEKNTQDTQNTQGESESKDENENQNPGTAAEEKLFKAAMQNKSVRQKILEEYFHSLKKGYAPLTQGGLGTFSAPPKSVKSIADAGKMALEFLRSKNKQ